MNNPTQPDIIEELAQTQLFGNVSPVALGSILARSRIASFREGDVILWRGEQSDSILLVLGGIVVITAEKPWTPGTDAWAFLKPGDCLGEVGVLMGDFRSATATAANEVQVMLLDKEAFLDLLSRYPSVGLNLSTMLARRLHDSAARMRVQNRNSKLVAVIGADAGVGTATIARALRHYFAELANQKAAYGRCSANFQDPADWDFPDHVRPAPLGDALSSIPAIVHIQKAIEYMLESYDVAVLSIPGPSDRSLTQAILGRAHEVILVAGPDTPPDLFTSTRNMIAENARRGMTAVCTVLNRANRTPQTALEKRENFDFRLEVLSGLQPGFRPPEAEKAFNALGDKMLGMMGKPHSVAIYIPTTVDVDTPIDAQIYVQRAGEFLGDCFGGATVSKQRGLWKSDGKGIVKEDIYVIRSYSDEKSLATNVPKVAGFMKELKIELAQEAMAMDIDGRLVII